MKPNKHIAQNNIPKALFCIFTLIAVAMVSISNGAVHVLPITEGDATKAALFFAPVLLVGFIIEWLIERAGPFERYIHNTLLKFIGIASSIGFIGGVALEAYPLFDFHFEIVILISQVGLEVVTSSILFRWLKTLFKTHGQIVFNAQESFRQNTLQGFSEARETLEVELDKQLTRALTLQYHHKQNYLSHLRTEKALAEQELDQLLKREAVLNQKLNNTKLYEETLTSS